MAPAAPLFYKTCGVSRYHHPLNPLNPMNPRAKGPSLNLAPKGETTHYDLCVALLLQIMFAVHAEGASKSLLRISPFFSTIKRKRHEPRKELL